jgi:hypothetical protein
MLRRLLWASALLALGLFIWRFAYPAALSYFFRLDGRAELASPSNIAPNSMLFLVVRNASGVPVAVKKIINPSFPLDFDISRENLIMPDLVTDRLTLEAYVNTHGRLAEPRRGDLKGNFPEPVRAFRKGIHLRLSSE